LYSFKTVSLFLVFILSITTLSLPFASGQAGRDFGFNWRYPNYDGRATNHNPQNQITIETIGDLTDEWATPFISPAIIPGITLQPGVRAQPIAENGVLYLVSNFLDTFSYRAETGIPIWIYAFPVNITQVVTDFPAISPFDSGVLEGVSIFERKVMMPTPDCGMVFLDSANGQPSFVGDLTRGAMCSGIEGNEGFYTGQMLYSPAVYERGRVLITGTAVSGKVESGRGYIAGFNPDTGGLMWRFFLMPPAGGDPSWASQYSGLGNVDPVRGDWGNARGVGVGVGWGQWAVDEETGIVYVGTSAPGPNFNGANRPGPNLFSSSILALDAMTGELIWYYQTSPHDLNAHGCLWNTLLGNIGENKVVFKACDNGRIYALDAATGDLIWTMMPPTLKRVNVDDPFVDEPDLGREVVSATPYWQCPGITGGTGGDLAFAYGRIYYATTNYCDYLSPTSANPSELMSWGADFPEAPYEMPRNTTIYALDASTGNIDWTFDISPAVSHRGGLIASGNLVFVSSLNGRIYPLDASTGDEIYVKPLGAALGIPPTIAAAANGEQFLYQTIGGLPARYTTPVSGLIVALKIRGGPQVPIIPPDENGDMPPEPVNGAQLPLTLLIPAVVVIAVVFLLAAFGRRALNSRKRKPPPSVENQSFQGINS